jgi:hypothetical protein
MEWAVTQNYLQALPIIYIGLCLAVFISFCFLIYYFWLLYRSKINADYAETARIILKINMFLVSVIFLITMISKETIIGYDFLMFIVPMLFSFVLFLFFFQRKS